MGGFNSFHINLGDSEKRVAPAGDGVVHEAVELRGRVQHSAVSQRQRPGQNRTDLRRMAAHQAGHAALRVMHQL